LMPLGSQRIVELVIFDLSCAQSSICKDTKYYTINANIFKKKNAVFGYVLSGDVFSYIFYDKKTNRDRLLRPDL
jgi:uncharacterized protein (UPF0297 family)